MPGLQFPDNPNVGDVFQSWSWDGTRWRVLAHEHPFVEEAPEDNEVYGRKDAQWTPIVGEGAAGDSVYAATPPADPRIGQLWANAAAELQVWTGTTWLMLGIAQPLAGHWDDGNSSWDDGQSVWS